MLSMFQSLKLETQEVLVSATGVPMVKVNAQNAGASFFFSPAGNKEEALKTTCHMTNPQQISWHPW